MTKKHPESMDDDEAVVIEKVTGVLSKFQGDSTDPKDEIERIHVEDGRLIRHEFLENGEVVDSIVYEGGDLDAPN